MFYFGQNSALVYVYTVEANSKQSSSQYSKNTLSNQYGTVQYTEITVNSIIRKTLGSIKKWTKACG